MPLIAAWISAPRASSAWLPAAISLPGARLRWVRYPLPQKSAASYTKLFAAHSCLRRVWCRCCWPRMLTRTWGLRLLVCLCFLATLARYFKLAALLVDMSLLSSFLSSSSSSLPFFFIKSENGAGELRVSKHFVECGAIRVSPG